MNSQYDTYMLRGVQSLVGTHVSNLFRFQNTVNKSCMIIYDHESRLITKVLPGCSHVLLGNNESCLVFSNTGKLTHHFNPPEAKAINPKRVDEPQLDTEEKLSPSNIFWMFVFLASFVFSTAFISTFLY